MDGEARSLARLALDSDVAAVLFDNLFDDGQAQSRAAFLGGKERLKDARAGGLIHAASLICNGDARVLLRSVFVPPSASTIPVSAHFRFRQAG